MTCHKLGLARHDFHKPAGVIAFCVAMVFAQVASGQSGNMSGGLFGGPRSRSLPSLRTLPPMRAVPIDAKPSSVSPDALNSPWYCDDELKKQSASIRGIAFFDSALGIAVGDHGTILTTSDGGRTWSRQNSGVGCSFRDAIWLNSRRVLAVGGGFDTITAIARGMIVVSNDAGKTWTTSSDPDLPCFHSIDIASADSTSVQRANRARNKLRLVAGTTIDPVSGSNQFSSTDGGRTWRAEADENQTNAIVANPELVPTIGPDQLIPWCRKLATNVPMRCWHRVNDQVIVCGGDHGLIFRSTDSGRSWQRVHGQDHASAVLVIANSIAQIPWVLIGREAIEKRNRVSVLVGGNDATDHALARQAALHCGAVALDVLHDSADPFASMKQWISLHQAPIIAIDAAFESDLKGRLLQHAVESHAQRIVEYSRRRKGAALLHDSAALPESGILAGDFLADNQLLTMTQQIQSPLHRSYPWLSIETSYGGSERQSSGDSLSNKLNLDARYRLPRRKEKPSRRRLQVVQGRLKQQDAIGALCERYAEDAQTQDSFAVQMRRLLDQTSRGDRFRAAWMFAEHTIGTNSHLDALEEIGRRFPDSSAGRLAALRARVRNSSVEWKHSKLNQLSTNHHSHHAKTDHQVDSSVHIPKDAAELLPGDQGHASIISPFQIPQEDSDPLASKVVQASNSVNVPLHPSTLPGSTLPGSNLPGSTLPPSVQPGSNSPAEHPSRGVNNSTLDLAWQMHPVRLLIEHAIARQMESESSDSDVSESADLRRVSEQGTLWATLLRKQSPQVAIAVRSSTPPHLDGQLDEPIWSNANRSIARTRSIEPVRIQAAWDDQYVYFGIQTRSSAFQVHHEDQPQQFRDVDLTMCDRLQLGIDLDRDLVTSMNLALARNGQTHDDLDHDPRWNPTWFFASEEFAGWVTTEIAIEQSSLGVTIAPGQQWFLNAQVLSAGTANHTDWMPRPQTRVRVDF